MGFEECKKARMRRKGSLTIRKGGSRKKATTSSFPSLWFWPSEVQKLYYKRKLPKMGGSRIENLKVTSIPRILHYIDARWERA